MAELSTATPGDCYWFHVIMACVSFICTFFSFVICTKKSTQQPTTTNVNNGEEQDPPEQAPATARLSHPITGPRQSNATGTSRNSYPRSDMVTSARKSEEIRIVPLKVVKQNPDYDTIADLKNVPSLRKQDYAVKSQPVRAHIYEVLESQYKFAGKANQCQQVTYEVTQFQQRQSDPQFAALKRVPGASKTKIEAEPTQMASGLGPNVDSKLKKRRSSRLGKRSSKLTNEKSIKRAGSKNLLEIAK